jgi:hypothetical protein
MARNVINEQYDPTGSCDHYNNPGLQNFKRIKIIGKHKFCK